MVTDDSQNEAGSNTATARAIKPGPLMTLSRLIDNATNNKPVRAAEEPAMAAKAVTQLSGAYPSTGR